MLRASVPAAATPAHAPGSGAAGSVQGQLGYGVAITVGVLVLVSTVMLASYICFRAKARAAGSLHRLVDADTHHHQSAAVVVLAGLDGPTIDVLYPKFFLRAGSRDGKSGASATVADGPCAICLGEFDGAATLRRGSRCAHCFHAGCAERWLRVSATCPVCRDSPVPSPAATALAAHAR
ncbi:hypothetical protein CFC21_065139 [Triticum aestivum]|uniref:RING-type domain-containing protein n=2 Tax=Triticum aestivum TaxID=4565 RepID=A0A9R1H406_WHEAT|nr:hypothetical protein CFC21_065139 [Triticum aestivum]